MKRKLLLPALIIATLTATPAFAQVQKGAFTASIFEGGYTFDGNQHLQTDTTHGVRLGYNLLENWGIEGQFSHVRLKSTLPVTNKGDQYSIRGDLLYHFLPKSNLVPFAVLGMGGTRTTNNFFYNDNDDITVDYGAGVKYFLTDRVALRGDIRNILSFHTAKYGAGDYWSNYEYTAGLTFQFGGTRAAAPPIAMAKPVTVTEAPRPEPRQQKLPEPQPVRTQVSEPALPASSSAPPAAGTLAATVAPKAAPLTAPLPIAVAPVPQVTETTGVGNGCKVSTFANIVIGTKDVEVISDLGIETYKVFRLSAPTRLVIDIFCATYGSEGKTLKFAVNRMGISSLRAGTHPGKMRVVLDSPLAKFPGYRLEKTERG